VSEAQENSIGETNKSHKALFDPKSIAIVTGTLYPAWYEGDAKDPLSVDKLRGDLALQTFQSAQQRSFNIFDVDGGSSEAFKKVLKQNNIYFEIQNQGGGQGPARRQGLNIAESNVEVSVICQTEPEKISIVSDCIEIASLPILKNDADIVMPARNIQSFSTYPQYQAEQEQKANALYNKILRSHGLLKENDPDLDFSFGPKFLANKPEVTELFKEIYQFKKGITAIDAKVNVEMYSNPLLFPVVAALHKGLRVKAIEVPYRHPRAQTTFEEGSPSFDRRRDTQRRTIITELINFIRYLENSPKTRLSKML
jgi:hypothetical protein